MAVLTYALIGDSQGEGLKVPLLTQLSLVFTEPHVGWTTGRIFGAPLDGALASSADVVLAVTGGNDDPLNNTAFDAAAARIRRAGKQLIVVGPVFAKTSDAARHDRARAALIAAAARNGVRFIDAYPLTTDLATTTNVHLGAAGYRTYASRLTTALRPTGGGALGVGVLVGLGALALWKWS